MLRFASLKSLWTMSAILALTSILPNQLTATITGGGSQHSTDGIFQTGEWVGPNVVVSCFPIVGLDGGGCVYVAQGSSGPNGNPAGGGFNTLFLGYDDLNPAAGENMNPATTPVSFDVFFQTGGEDYDIHIVNGGFTAFNKPTSQPSLLNGDGSFDLNSPPWKPATDDLSQFHAALGFGPSPDNCPTGFCNTLDHLTAEFDLTVNTNFGQPGTQSNGVYDPAPAFWSGTGNDGAHTIISESFTLNTNTGQTTVTPQIGSNGAPIQQSNVPEPSTFLLGGLALLLLRKR